MRKKIMKFVLQPLTYVHIGNGEDLDPFRYIIKDNKFYLLNETAYVRYLLKKDAKNFKRIVDGGSLKFIASYYSKHFNASAEYCSVQSYGVSNKIQENYNEKLKQHNNRQQIKAFIRDGNFNKPFIPGSAIKGAIRTAVLYNIKKSKNISGVSEDKLLNYTDVTSDPFKYLKISDVPIKDEDISVAFIEVLYRNSGDLCKRAPSYFAEVIFKERQKYEGRIIIEENDTLSPEIIAEALNSFNEYTINNDRDTLPTLKEYKDKTNYIKGVYQKCLEKPKNNMLIRIGKGCSKLGLSYIQQETPKTVTVADSKPLGWCFLSLKEE